MIDGTERALVLFYYFSLLDGELSLKLARRSLDQLRLVQDEGRESFQKSFIEITQRHFKAHRDLRKSPHRMRGNLSVPTFLKIEPNNLKSWSTYWKKSPDEEMLSLIWTQILRFKEEVVAEALQITPGNLTHRLSRGLVGMAEANRA